MLLGTERYRLAGEELVRIVGEELAGFGLPSDLASVADALGMTEAELEARMEVGDQPGLDDLVARWDRFAVPRGLARLVSVDHGDEVEILIGHPLRPKPHVPV